MEEAARSTIFVFPLELLAHRVWFTLGLMPRETFSNMHSFPKFSRMTKVEKAVELGTRYFCKR